MNEHEARQQRIWLLLRQGRIDLAEQELRLYLADHPDSDFAHAQLALCLVQSNRYQEAHQEATAAVGLAPGNPFVHFVHSIILTEANCLPEAEAAAREAINLDQSTAMYFGQLAKVHLRGQKWKEALAAAEEGLQIDPADDTCANLRSIALIRLGRRVEATDTLRGAMERDPDDPWTHANLGWSLIETGRYTDAMPHFREALRLDPNMEHARLGIITALKAQHFLYRPLLRYFLWTQKLNDRFAVLLMIGAFLLVQYLSGLAAQKPEWSPFITPVLIAYLLFAVSTWLANPLFNLVLFTNKFGRLALSNEERYTALLVGALLAIAAGMFSVSFVIPIAEFSSLGILLAALPLSRVFDVEPGRSRWMIAGVGALVIAMSVFPVAFVCAAVFVPGAVPELLLQPGLNLSRFCVNYLGYAAIGSQFLSQSLMIRRPRRISL